MRHAGGMRRVERVGNLDKKINCALEAQGISLETGTKRLPRHQLHRYVEHRRTHRRPITLRRALPDVVDGDEMRVIQCGRGSRLQHESLETIRIARDALAKDLEREIAAEHGVFGEIDLAHAAARDQAGNVEAPDRRVRQVLFGHQGSSYLTGPYAIPDYQTMRHPESSLLCEHD